MLDKFTAESWKTIALVCISIIVTGLTSWMAFGKDVVTNDDLINALANDADKAVIQQINRDQTENLKKINSLLEKNGITLTEHEVRLDHLEKR